jgi:hypothetical protein
MRIIECVHDTVGVYFAGERALSVGRPCECLPRVGLGLLSGRRQGVNWDRWKQPMSRWVADVFPARPGRCSDSGLGWVQDAAFRAVPYRTRQSSHTSLELNKAHFSRGNRRPPDWVNGTCIQGPIARWIRKKGTAPVAQLKNSSKWQLFAGSLTPETSKTRHPMKTHCTWKTAGMQTREPAGTLNAQQVESLRLVGYNSRRPDPPVTS